MSKQTEAAAGIERRLCRLSDEIKNLYDAVSRIDAEAYDLSYDVIHLRNMLETDNEEAKAGKEPNE